VCDIGGLVSHVTVVFLPHRIPGSMPENLPDRGMVFASTKGRLASLPITTNNTTRCGWTSNVICDAMFPKESRKR